MTESPEDKLIDLEAIKRRLEWLKKQPDYQKILPDAIGDIEDLIAETERLREMYSIVVQGIWLCPEEEVEYSMEEAEQSASEARRQSLENVNARRIRHEENQSR